MKTRFTFKSLLSLLLTVCMLAAMVPAISVKTEALYGLDGITGSGTKDDPAVVDTWLELKCALEAATDAYITVDAGNFGHTTNNGYSYLFKSLHYPSGSFITVPAGYTKNVKFTSYTLKFVASPDASNGPLENFILNKGNLTIDGLGKLYVGFNTTSGSASIFKNEGSLTFNGGMDISTDFAEVDGVKAMAVNNNGYLRVNGGHFIGSNNAKSGPNKGGYSYAINTGAGTGIQTEIYGGSFKATNTSGGEITVGIYNPAQYANNNTTKLYGGFYYGIWNTPNTGSSMNSLDNCLGDDRVYREGANGEKLFNGKGITYVEADKEIRVSNLKDWIDFDSQIPEITTSGGIAESETLRLGASKEYSFTYSGLPAWLANAGYTCESDLYVILQGGSRVYNASGLSLDIKDVNRTGKFYVIMSNTLYDGNGEYITGYQNWYPVEICAEVIDEINVEIENPLPGYRATDVDATVLTPGVKIKEIEWCVVTGEGTYDYTTMDNLDRFESGKDYKCWITFIPEEGSEFKSGISAYFNGDSGEKGFVDKDTATYCWNFTSRNFISFDNAVLPDAGDSALKPIYYDFSSSGAVYVPNVTWFDSNDNEFTGEFVAGEDYTAVFEVAMRDGSSFLKKPEELLVTFNGVEVGCTAKEGSNGKAVYVAVKAGIYDYYIDIDGFTYPLAGDISGFVPEFEFDSNIECRVESVSILDFDGNKVTNLVAGQEYVAQFFIVSPEFPSANSMNVTVNDKNVDGFQIRSSRDMGVIEVIFTATDIPFLFTEDSGFYAGAKAKIDLEAMAEYSDAFMEAYLEESLYITWYYNGDDSVFMGPMASSYTWKEEYAGNTFFVEVKYGDKYVYSDTFVVTAEEYVDVMKGDVTGDGKVNLSDISLILKYIAKWDVTLNEKAADVTGDGKINLSDVSLILKYIAKWDVEFK